MRTVVLLVLSNIFFARRAQAAETAAAVPGESR